jgi:hypothetical protein
MRLLAFLTGLVVVVLLAIGGPAYAASPITYYVNDDAAGADNGTSWKNAFTDLQSALAVAAAGDSVWVAAGTYKPSVSIDDSTDARTASFSLKSGVALYGGFAGVEKDLKKRSSDPALTVLSGDIGVAGDATDNSYHVVYAKGVSGAVLDGFTVTLGRGDRAGIIYMGRDTQGAGMYNYESALTVANCVFSDNRVDGKVYGSVAIGGGMYSFNSAPTVVDCTFTSNRAGGPAGTPQWGRGGGMYNEGMFGSSPDGSWPRVTGCTFTDNVAWSRPSDGDPNGGGGMYNTGGMQTIERCTFTRNSAGQGGAMLNHMGQPTVTNCFFAANSATIPDGLGGAICNYGAATIMNCTFHKNGWSLLTSGPEPRFRPYAAMGGAIYSYRAPGTITNCIFSENGATGVGGGIAYHGAARWGELTNCLFYENIRWPRNYDPEIAHVSGLPIPGFTASDNLYDVDPLLMDPSAGDLHLRYDSPCIDAGFSGKQGNYTWPWGLPVIDFDGDKRVADGDGDGTPKVDIGADEYIANLPGLRAFLTALSDAEEIDSTLAARLLGYVDAASAALAQDQEAAAVGALNELIADAKATLGETELAQLIEMKTKAVIGEI